MQQLRSQLLSGAEQMDIQVSEEQANLLLTYLDLLVKWNKTYNLTAVREPVQMVSRHLLDSLSIFPHIHGKNILDVGSGAGLPGIPLAIMSPETHFTLLDSNGKKTRFMMHVVRTLGLSNVTVEQRRVESWTPESLFDVITSRAFSSLDEMVKITEHLLANQGQWLAMKGLYPEDEVVALQQSVPGVIVKDAAVLSVPGSEGSRHLVMLIRYQAK